MALSYTVQYAAAWVVAAVLAICTVFKHVDPVSLGMPPQTTAWASLIFEIGAGLALILPRVTAIPNEERTGLD